MLSVSQNNTNIPMGSASTGFTVSGGIHNEFAVPEVDDGRSTERDTIKLFLVLALIFTILLATGSYFYTGYLNSKVEAQKLALSNLDSNPDILTFEKSLPGMRELSKKLKLLNSVNDSRVYISGMFFPILESVVESSRNSYVYFNNISIQRSGDNSVIKVAISGTAQDYPTLSRQITNFKSGPLSSHFSNFKFLSFKSDVGGTVTFSVTFDMDVSTNSYLTFLKTVNDNNSSQKNASGVLFKNSGPANIFSDTSNSSSATSSLKNNSN